MSKKAYLVSNTLVIAASNLSVQLASFLLLPLYTAYLTTADYGIVDLVFAYTALLAPIATLQLDMAVFRFLIDARNNKESEKLIISSALRATGLFMLVFMAIFWVITNCINIAYAPIVLFTVCVASISNLFLQFARGMGRNKSFAIGGLIAGAVTITLNIMLIAVFRMGAVGMLIAASAGSLSCVFYLLVALRIHRYVDFKRTDNLIHKELLRYSLPLLPNGISWWVINTSDRTIISIFLGLSANGVYAVAYKFPTFFGMIFSFFNMSWAESAAMHIHSSDRDKFFSDVSNASVKFFGSLAALMLVAISLVFDLFVNSSYQNAYVYIPILMAASFFNAVVGSYSAIYVALKKTKQVANTSLFAAAINIVLSLALVKAMGLYATAIATAIAYLAMAVYRHYDTRKYVNISYEKKVFIKVAALFGAVTVLYYCHQPLLSLIGGVVATVAAGYLNKEFISTAKDTVLRKYKVLCTKTTA